MCDKALELDPWRLGYVPDHFKTQEMFIKSIQANPFDVSDHLKTQKMYNEAVAQLSCILKFDPDDFKRQEMCNEAVAQFSYNLKYVPDWFVTQSQVKIWHDGDSFCNNNTNGTMVIKNAMS